MARVRTRMPRVFVGHPFSGRFPVKKFRSIFRELPFDVIYGNTDLQTKHLLSLMKSNIRKADYSIYDLSNWNPNVALELGLSEGLKKASSKDYFILLNTKRSKEVPSDIRGIQRLEYTSYDFKDDSGLGYQLIQYILSKEYWIKKVWKAIPDQVKATKKRTLALRVLAYLREHDNLLPDNLSTLSRGTRLRKDDRDAVVEVLFKLKLIKKAQGKKSVYVLRRGLYIED